MTVKQILEAVRQRYFDYEIVCEKAKRYKQFISAAKGVRYTESKGHTGNGTEASMIKALEYDENMQTAYAAYEQAVKAAEALIASLESYKEKEVLTRKYLFFQSWEEICKSMKYSRRHILRLSDEALKKL